MTQHTEDDQTLIDAIAQAERGNYGEIMVHIEDICSFEEPLDRAKELFFHHKMNQTQNASGILLYVALESRKVAIFADSGIYPAKDPSFWQKVIDDFASMCAKDMLIEGVCSALQAIGDLLRLHLPKEDTAGNELPNQVHYEQKKDRR